MRSRRFFFFILPWFHSQAQVWITEFPPYLLCARHIIVYWIFTKYYKVDLLFLFYYLANYVLTRISILPKITWLISSRGKMKAMFVCLQSPCAFRPLELGLFLPNTDPVFLVLGCIDLAVAWLASSVVDSRPGPWAWLGLKAKAFSSLACPDLHPSLLSFSCSYS